MSKRSISKKEKNPTPEKVIRKNEKEEEDEEDQEDQNRAIISLKIMMPDLEIMIRIERFSVWNS
jgi:hypothetical protein